MGKAKKRRIEIEDLFRLRLINGVELSPDGERLVYSLSRTDPRKNKVFSSLYEVPFRGGRTRRLTRGDHRDSMPRFSPDGSRLAFLSDRDKGSSVFILPLDGGEVERVTDRDGVVTDFSWSSDGRHLAVALRALTEREKLARDEKKDELERMADFRVVTRLFHKMDGAGFRSGEFTHIHLVPLGAGRPRQLTAGDHDHFEPRISPDGRRVSFLSNRTADPDRFQDNLDIYTVGRDGKGLRKISREPGPASGHVWSPDGRTIFYLGHTGGPGEWSEHNLHLRRVAAGGGPSTDLTPDLDTNAMNMVIGDTAGTDFGGPPPVVSPDGGRVFFCATHEGASHLAAVPAGGGAIEEVLTGDVAILGFGVAPDGGSYWATVADFLNPADIYRFAGGAAPKRLTRVNSRLLGGLDLAEPEEIRVPRKGGEVHGWIIRPQGARKGRKLPLVLQVHGGPHAAYGHVFFHEMQLLAAKGYMVLMTNPRGSDGYGRAHRTAIHAAWGGVDADDILTALDSVLGDGEVDPKRLYLTGGSYGGYMTNWLVGHTNRFRAAVTQRSVANLASFFGTSDIGYEFAFEFEGAPWEAKKRYEKISPLTYAAAIETPLLIIHSEEDHRCPISQAEELFTTLKYMGREVEMVRFVGESHGLSRGGRPQNRAERLRRILDWFKRHGGR